MAFLKYRGSTTSPGTWTSNVAAGTALTNLDIDKNFASLDGQKLDLAGGTITGGLSVGTNLTAELKDSTVLFVDGDDTSKKLAFQLSGIAVSTTRTLTIPNATGTIALTSDFTDTLSSVTGRGASTATAISITNATASTSTSTGALQVTGGAGIGGNLYVGGDLNVNGTTTTINSTIVSYDDPILTLGGDTSVVETTKDRGIEFKWNGASLTITNYIGNGTTTVTATVASTTGFIPGDIITISGAVGTEQTKLNGTWTIASILTTTTFTFIVTSSLTSATYTVNIGTCVRSKNGFFGLDQSTGYFSFRPQALNTSEVFSGTLGDIEATSFRGNLIGTVSASTGSFSGTLTLSSIAATAATDLTLTGAGSSTTAGTAYAITVTGGAGGDSIAAGKGGAVNITGGRSGNNANAGAAVYGGAVNITGGSGNTLFAASAPGGVVIAGGVAQIAGQSGANVSVSASAGYSSATAAAGGNLTLSSGAGAGTGNNGYVSISAPGQAGGTAPYISFTTGTAERLKIDNTTATFTVNGSFTGTVDGSTFNSTSDIRLKSEIKVIDNALDKTLSLSGYTFLLNSDKSKRQTGVIAQEVLKVLPEAVSGTEDTHYSVSYGNIVGLLIEAIKELNAKVTNLQNQIENK